MSRIFSALTVLILALLAGGCASVAIPPRLNPAERDLVRSTHIPAVVGVRPYERPVYSDKLVTALRRTGLFEEVGLIGDLQREPDLVATVERRVSGTAILPLFTLLSLGVIPTVVDETHGYVFSLRSARETSPVLIDYRYTGPTTLGWAAMFLNISTRRTIRNPYETDRLNDALSAAIAKRAGEIRALLPEGGGAGPVRARSR